MSSVKGQILIYIQFYFVSWTLLPILFFPMINNLNKDTLAGFTDIVSDFFQHYVQSVRLSTDQQPQFLQGYPPMVFTGISLSCYAFLQI